MDIIPRFIIYVTMPIRLRKIYPRSWNIWFTFFFSDIIYRGIVVKELFSETKAIFEKFLQYGWLFAAGFYLVYVIYWNSKTICWSPQTSFFDCVSTEYFYLQLLKDIHNELYLSRKWSRCHLWFKVKLYLSFICYTFIKCNVLQRQTCSSLYNSRRVCDEINTTTLFVGEHAIGVIDLFIFLKTNIVYNLYRKSFPSGHSGAAWNVMTYLAVSTIQKNLVWRSVQIANVTAHKWNSGFLEYYNLRK